MRAARRCWLPGVTIGGGFGLASNLPTLTSGALGGPLQPDIASSPAAKPAPPGGVGGFITMDLAKVPGLSKYVAPILDRSGGERPK